MMFDARRPVLESIVLAVALATAIGPIEAQERRQVLARVATDVLPYQASGSSTSYQSDREKGDILSKPALLSVRDVELAVALDALHVSSGVDVAYSPSLVPKGHLVTCECGTLSIEEAVGKLLGGTDLHADVSAGQLFIAPSDAAGSVAVPFAASVQPVPTTIATASSPGVVSRYEQRVGTVTGRVTDGLTLQPLGSVQVVILGLNVGTISRSDGTYTLVNVPAGSHSLEARVIGYRPAIQAVTVADLGTAIVNFQLAQTAVALDEVVVVGYGTQTRATLSGSVSSIASEDIERTSATTTTDALIGKIPGINTRNTLNTGQFQFSGDGAFGGREAQDGRPGATTVVQIRNMGTPLFVIDGIPVSQKEFDNLNASDIENISVLKDASASIYGFRASNGVILVTTKRGETDRAPELRIDGYYGWQHVKRSRSPWGWVDNAYQFTYSQLETEQNTGIARSLTPQELESWRTGAPGYESYDYWNAVVNNQNALQGTVNANVSGGAGNATYYLSLGHVTQDYVIDDNNFNRTNFQSNLRAQLFDGFSVGTELRGRLENHINTAQTDASDPINMHFQSIQRGWPTENWYANNNPDFINGNVRLVNINPAIFSRDISGTQDQIRRNVSGNFWAEYELPFGPTLRGTYNLTNNWHDFDVHRFTYNAYCYDADTDTYSVCSSYNGGSRQHLKELEEKRFGQLQLSFARQFLESHSLSAVGAVELVSDEGNHTEVRAVTTSNINSLIELQNVTFLRNAWMLERRASYAGRVNYDYRQKYLLELLGRYDGSYLYAQDKRWGFFPGVSAGWRISEEPFFRDRIGFIDELKLRASWGQAGREQGVNPWGYLGGVTYPAATSVLDGQLIAGARPRGLPITNLSWVTSTSTNVGIEFGLLERRLSGEIDIFERKLTGLPASRNDVLLPNEVGYNLPNENLESEANRGIEGILRYTDRIGDVSFSFAPNATLARRKILDRYKPRYGNSYHRYRSGTENRWVGGGFGGGASFTYQALGQFQTVEEIANHPVDIDGQGNRTMLPGDIYYKDVNGDGLIDSLDQRPLGYPGNTPPLLSFGMAGSVSYGNFTLSHDWAGGALFNVWPNALRQPYTGFDNGGQFAWSRWRRADPFNDQSEWIPGRFPPLRKGSAGAHTNGFQSDFYEFKAWYLRLNRLELGYTLPAEFGERIGASRARVYVSGANQWVMDNGSHKWSADPEQAQCCGQLYPPSSNVTVGFSATLGGGTNTRPAVPLPAVGDDD